MAQTLQQAYGEYYVRALARRDITVVDNTVTPTTRPAHTDAYLTTLTYRYSRIDNP